MRRGRRAAGGGVVQTCIEIDSWSAPAHSKLPAVEDGPHLGGDAIRGIKEQLQADRQKVRQSLLAATPHMDMGKGWGRSQARASELQWHSMYLCGRQK
jgi:hypothetical protein